MPIIANTSSANTFSATRAQLNAVTKRLNQFAGNESTLYANTINANVSLRISGTDVRATFAQNTYVKSVLANTNSYIASRASWTGLTGTNTALRTLISDRLQVANASTLYATKASPTTSGLLAHTGRATISTNLGISGNVNFSSTGNRITGDFSNATVTNRLLFQSSTGTFTDIGALGPGAAQTSAWTAYYGNDPTNTSRARMVAFSTDARFESSITGSGTYLPMTFQTGGSERMRIDTSGNVGISGNGGSSTNRLSFTYNGSTGEATIGPNSTGGSTFLTLGTSSSGTYAERMRIDSSGRIGMGVTPSTGASLAIKAIASGTADGRIEINKYLGTSASPTESQDWPLPAIGIRTFQDYSSDTMMSFGLSNDAFYKTDNSVWNFRLAGITNATTSGSSTHLEIGGPGVLFLYGTYTQASGSLRAPIFYDTDNTGYYIDAAGGSSLSTLTTYGGGGGLAVAIRNGGDLRVYNADNSGSAGIYSDTNSFIQIDSILQASGSVRAPIFYDSENTAFVCDPTGRSNLTYITNGPVAGSTTTGNQVGLEIKNNGGTGEGNVAAMSFHCTSSYGMHLHLRADGYFGAGGWSASAWRWYVNMGNGDMTAAGNVTAYSDPRLKEDIQKIESPVDKLKRLNGVRFRWKNESILGHPGKYDYGVLANEVQEVFPEIVCDTAHESPDGDKYKAVAYDKLVPVLIESIKEQQNQIDELRTELRTLRGTE